MRAKTRANLLTLLPVLLILAVNNLGNAADLSGTWKGKWNTTSPTSGRQHHGSLRVRLRASGCNSYRGVFAGRFAVVIPYIYRAKVYQCGNTLVSTRKLGPFGEYRMQLQYSGHRMTGIWSAGGESGSINLLNKR